jgi:two-component system cell cycle response regulator
MIDDKSSTNISRAVALAEPEPGAGTAPPPPRPMYLIVVVGGIPGAMIRLAAEETRIGRSNDNPVRLPDLSASRLHASIDVRQDGTAWLTDLNSTNGTFLNRRRLIPQVPTLLEDGDRLQFGAAYVVKFVSLDPCDEQFQRELFERSVRDPLTGLYNRAYFLEQLGATAEAGASRGLGLAVLMLDVDHFKRVNDTYGHDSGDAVLREVAQVLRECTRSEDLVARYGGEEFILALTVAAPDQATERAERIRAEIAARKVFAGGETLRVTASIGLTFARPGGVRSPQPKDLIIAADQGLYQAKHAGRNRVVLRAEPAPCDDLALVATPNSDELARVDGR